MVNYIIGIDMFTHPKSVCLTYYQHFCFSMNVTKKLLIGSIKSFIHAIYPDIFITTTSDHEPRLNVENHTQLFSSSSSSGLFFLTYH